MPCAVDYVVLVSYSYFQPPSPDGPGSEMRTVMEELVIARHDSLNNVATHAATTAQTVAHITHSLVCTRVRLKLNRLFNSPQKSHPCNNVSHTENFER